MMRTLLAVLLAGCSSTSTPTKPEPTPAPAPPATPDAGSAASAMDAGVAAVAPVPPVSTATPIPTLAMAGPYPTLAASCAAAPPCGFTDMTADGKEIKPPTKPDCSAVLDPSRESIGHLPSMISGGSGAPKLTHKAGDSEYRIGGVRCAVPQGLRREASEHYVFVKRADGWWRTEKAVVAWDYNEKYCDGSAYVLWNDKPGRTIVGLAVGEGCLACSKQGNRETLLELMLRIEPAGDKPRVFAPLPVGWRSKQTVDPSAVDADEKSNPDCKSSAEAISMKENWVSDDEVVLEGPAPDPKVHTGPLTDTLRGTSTIQPGPGRFKFVR